MSAFEARARRWIVAIVAAMVVIAAPAGARGQDAEHCVSPDMEILDESFSDSVLSVVPSEEIADLRVSMDITHGFIGDLIMELESPEGTVLTLMEESGDDGIGVLITWSDEGVEYWSDEFDCDCEMKPDGGVEGGLLSDFDGELTDGDWILYVEDVSAPDGGTLNEWCLLVEFPCDLEAPSSFACEVIEGDVELSWVGGNYTDVSVLRNGAEVAFLDGAAVDHVDENLAPGAYEYTVVGINVDQACEVTSEYRRAVIGDYCSRDAVMVSYDLGIAQSTVELVGDYDLVTDLEVAIDITHTFVGDMRMDLESPQGTSVRLHAGVNEEDEDILLTYSDAGVDNGEEFMTCACEMKPEGPGVLGDFYEDGFVGSWLLTIEDLFQGDDGTLNGWCMTVEGDLSTQFIRGDADGDGNLMPILDVVGMLEWYFLDGDKVTCMEAIDVDNDGSNVAFVDAIALLEYGFLGGPAPEAPFPGCGSPGADDDVDLGCDSSRGCD